MNAPQTIAPAAPDLSVDNVAAVVGIGHSDWRADYKSVRDGGKPHDSYGYGAVSLKRALEDAGLDRGDVDGLIVGATTSYERASELYGISARWGLQADSSQAIVAAMMAIKSGFCEVVALVFGNDQRSAKVQYGGPQAMGGGSNLSYVYHAPFGLTSQGALYALMQRRHMELTGATEADLGGVAVGQRAWAAHNPAAIMQGRPLSIEDYLASPYIAEPLHLPDYCLINDGGVALIVMEKSRSRRQGRKPVTIKTAARYDLHDGSTTLRPRLLDFYHTGHKVVSEKVYDAVSFGPKDVDALLVYDSFSCHILYALEGFGFCGIGESGPFIREVGIGPGGRLPVNTHGGHLSESYMQGWAHQIEAVRQLRGEAGLNVPNCRNVQYISDVVGRVYSIIYGVE
ncbi:thiolase family protein [Faunimonas sp. B44]|uniref:thiolase family protein n=1 Tax=Faunimonas sp. B44 TaxID=3461493 RepID=UPI00404509F4